MEHMKPLAIGERSFCSSTSKLKGRKKQSKSNRPFIQNKLQKSKKSFYYLALQTFFFAQLKQGC